MDISGKLKEVFEVTLDSDNKYENSLDNIDFYSLLCKSAAREQMHKFKDSGLFCMFNYKYEDSNAIIMVFAIPINIEGSAAKYISERVMEVVEIVEECFVTLDYVTSREVKEDKYVYIVFVKKVKEDQDEWSKDEVD